MTASVVTPVEKVISAPSDWTHGRLEHVLSVIRGVTYKSSESKDAGTDGYLPILRATNIGRDLNFDSLVYVPKDRVSADQLLRIGDIVIAASSGSRSVVGKAALLNQDFLGSFGAFCFALRPNEKVIPHFLAYFLQTSEYRNQVSTLSAGVNINNLRRQHIENIPFAHPPLDEQKQIVEAIETQFARLDDAVASLERAQTRLTRYRASVLKAACEGTLVPPEANLARQEGRDYEPASVLLERIKAERETAPGRRRSKTASIDSSDLFEVPEGWTWAKWDELADRVTVGHVGSMKDEYVPGGVPFLRSQNVRENKFDPNGLLYISPGFHERLSKSKIIPGDLAVVRSGSVGVTCVIPESLGEANCADLVLIQRPRGINPYFGAYYMNSLAKRLVRKGQVGVALTHFNTKSVAAMPVPVPPVAEQERIVEEVQRRLSVIDQMEATVEANLKRAESLRQSILRRAFSGRLVQPDEGRA